MGKKHYQTQRASEGKPGLLHDHRQTALRGKRPLALHSEGMGVFGKRPGEKDTNLRDDHRYQPKKST
jgi:hypothetical protein